MSCHQTHGGVAVTALARATTGFDDSQVSSIYHRLKREATAAGAPAPDAAEVQAWLIRASRDVQDMPGLSDKDRKRILDRMYLALDAADEGTLPDGPTFAAWQNTTAQSQAAADVLDATITAAARQQRIDPDRLGAKFRRWRQRDDFEEMESPDPAFVIDPDGLPSDKATAKALRKLGWENYLAQRLPVFTYGTLREGQHNAHLMDGAIYSRSTGRIDGVAIYGPGRGFPYAAESPDGEGYTMGDLVALTSDRSGDWSRESLDGLEGFSSDQYSDSHYRRVTRDVSYTDADGTPQTTKAWVYLAGSRAKRTLGEDERIHDGDWVTARGNYSNRFSGYYDAVRRRQAAESADGEYTGTIRVTQSSTDTPARSAQESAAAFEALFAATDADSAEAPVRGIPRRTSVPDADTAETPVRGIPRRTSSPA
jgi:gamma-glutamylcyclotransferase (GGCT)/AIG2-like uncharacterized protein YtfP